MANHVYKNEVGLAIILDCGQDVSAATGIKIKVKKPNNTEVEWDANVYNTNYIRYITQTNDLDLAGNYDLQSYMTLGSWTGFGDTARLPVKDYFG